MMRVGRVGRLAALAALALLVAFLLAPPSPGAEAMKAKPKPKGKPYTKQCPPNRCQKTTDYNKALIATRKRLAKELKVDFVASRTLPIFGVQESRKCRWDGGKLVSPEHICWFKLTPKAALAKATAKTRAIIVKAEAKRTGNCAKCPQNAFLYGGLCCLPRCAFINLVEGRKSPVNLLKPCCALSRVDCILDKQGKVPPKRFRPKTN